MGIFDNQLHRWAGVLRPISLVALMLALCGCGDDARTVGGKGVAGDYAALVNLRPRMLDVVTLDIYEDFTCPACQHFSLETLPALERRYGDALVVRVHYVAAPSMQPDALALYSIANARGEGEKVAHALWEAGLEHRVTPDNQERVRRVAQRFHLGAELQLALNDQAKMGEVSRSWLKVAHKVSHLPFVEIEGEVATNGNGSNLESILDSLLREPPSP